MDLSKLEEIKKLALMAMFSDDTLMENLVLKGGNALDIVYRIGARASLDLDFSMPGDLDLLSYSDKIQNTLMKTFQEHGLRVFDVKVKKRPKTQNILSPSFWGGYKIEFKVIDRELYTEHKDDTDFLRKQAFEIASNHKRIFSIDVSKHDYCDQKVEREIDGLTIYVYSPEMILFEKIRSLCQQMSDYEFGLSQCPRAKDFFDIYSITQHFDIDAFAAENLDLLRKIFAVKKVPLELINNIVNQREFHRPAFDSVRDTVKSDTKLQSYDFYFDFVKDLATKLSQALGIK